MQRLILRWAGVALACSFVTACSTDTSRSRDSAGAAPANARQLIPDGVDPRMVEWREDGVLVASPDSLRKTPGYVVDSVFPPEEAMRRFRATVPGSAPTRLAGGASSVDDLIRRYWVALTAADTSAVRSLSVSQAEFAYLYLPDSPEIRSGMQPAIAWLVLDEASVRGLSRARLRAEAARNVPAVGVACDGNEVANGAAQIQGPCGIVLQRAAGSDTIWIANRVILRDGVVKLLGFANPL